MNPIIKKLEAAKALLVSQSIFFGRLCGLLTMQEVTSIPTAATDGKMLYYNPTFIDSLTVGQIKTLIAHEICHCAAGHPWRLRGRDHMIANIAMDYEVNLILQESQGFFFPPNPLLDVKYTGMSWEQIYALILDKAIPVGCSLFGEVMPGTQPGKSGKSEDGKGIPTQVVSVEQIWKEASAHAMRLEKNRGTGAGGIVTALSDLMRPKIDFLALLLRFVQDTAKTDYTWRRPNPRYVPYGYYLPTLCSEEMPPMVMVLDTSASMSEAELQYCGGAIDAVVQTCRPAQTDVLYVDAAIQGHVTFYPGDLVKLEKRGGGGTDFRPAFTWVEEQQLEPACLLYLTDMDGCFPDTPPPYPVLWISTNRRKATAPFGEVVPLELP